MSCFACGALNPPSAERCLACDTDLTESFVSMMMDDDADPDALPRAQPLPAARRGPPAPRPPRGPGVRPSPSPRGQGGPRPGGPRRPPPPRGPSSSAVAARSGPPRRGRPDAGAPAPEPARPRQAPPPAAPPPADPTAALAAAYLEAAHLGGLEQDGFEPVTEVVDVGPEAPLPPRAAPARPPSRAHMETRAVSREPGSAPEAPEPADTRSNDETRDEIAPEELARARRAEKDTARQLAVDLALAASSEGGAPSRPPRRGRRLTAALLLVTAAAAGALGAGYVEHVRGEAARLRRDVDQALAATAPLASDAAAVRALREQLELARSRPFLGRTATLRDVEAGVAALEGLLALAGGDLATARATLDQPALVRRPACASALRGGIAALTSGGHAREDISSALAGGVVRAELRCWRLEAARRGGIADLAHAEEVLADLALLARAGVPTRATDAEVRAAALLALGRAEEAAQALAELADPPAALRQQIATTLLAGALERGDWRAALRAADALPDPVRGALPEADRWAARLRARAAPILARLARGPLPASWERELRLLLPLARRLDGEPLERETRRVLLDAAERARPFPSGLCLLLDEIGTTSTRRALLVRLTRRQLRTRAPAESAAVQLVIARVLLGARGAEDADAERLLAALRDPRRRAELHLARALAWGQHRRRALAEVQQGLRLAPDHVTLKALRARLLRSGR